jgi:hypothetical protein
VSFDDLDPAYFADEGDPRVKPLDEPIHLVTPSV